MGGYPLAIKYDLLEHPLFGSTFFFPFKALFTGDFPKTFTQTSISFSDFPAVLEDFIGPGIGT